MIEAARSVGRSPSVFLGRQPRAVTVYFRNPAGQVVRSETTTEPEWTDDDREALYALATFEADLCRGCGRPLAETTAPEREDGYQPAPAIRCHRCTAISQASDLYRESPHPNALMVPVAPKDAT